MKISHLLMGKKCLVVSAFFLLSLLTYAQTTLVNYSFNNNLNPDAGAIGNPSLITNGNFSYSNNMLQTRSTGNYLELTINTVGHSNLILSFKGEFESFAGNGYWIVSANTGANNSFVNVGTVSYSSFLWITDSKTSTLSLPAGAAENPNLKIRITSDLAVNLADYLRIDNLRLVSGSPNITISTQTNVLVPHQSEPSESYQTVFGNILTNSGGETRQFRIRNINGSQGSILSVSHIEIEPIGTTTMDDFKVGATSNLNNITRVTSIGSGTYGSFELKFVPQAEGVRSAYVKVYSNGNINSYTFKVVGGGRSCNIEHTPYVRNTVDTNEQTLPSNLTPSDFIGGTASNPAPTNIFPNFKPSGNLYASNSGPYSWYTKNEEKTREFGGEGVDISQLRNVSIEFQVAAFGRNTSSGVNSDDKIVLSVYDNGNWYDVMKLGGSGDSSRYRYGFNSGSTLEHTYNRNNINGNNYTISTTNNTSSKKYTSFKLNIPLSISSTMTQFKFRITAKANSDAVWLIDDVMIKSDNAKFVRYVGNAWTPSTPDANTKVIIEGNYQVPANGITVCECEVMEGGSITVAENRNFTVKGRLINHGDGTNIIVHNNANLLQLENAAENEGAITQEKQFRFLDTSNPNNDRKQYNFIISPLIGQNIKTIYPGNPTVIEHREHTNMFHNHNGSYTPGKALAIKEPSKTAVPSSTVNAVFKGVPFNGKLEYPIAYTINNGVDPGYNLIGNPYPSNLDIQKFYEDNKHLIEPTFYFWDNRGNTLFVQHGSAYDGSHYAVYNAVSETGAPIGMKAPEANGEARVPNHSVKVGTGFMVQAKPTANGQNLVFRNEQRTTDNTGPQFFGKGNFESTPQKDRFWVSLLTPENFELMTAVVYLPHGSNEVGIEDTRANGSSDEIYTWVGEEQLLIQGRASFVNTDEVNLGIRLFNDGKHKINIYQPQGVFAHGQKIYLKDNFTGKIYDFAHGAYEFESRAGEYNDRFVILYKRPGSLTASVSLAKNEVQILKKDNQVEIHSSMEKITQIEIFNLSGFLIQKYEGINAQDFVIHSLGNQDKLVIVKLITESGEKVSKKLMNL